MDSVNRMKIVAIWPTLVGTDLEKITALAALLQDQYAEGIFGSPTHYSIDAIYWELRNLGMADSDFSILEAVDNIH